MMAATFALLSWRTGLGGLSAYETQSGTMMLGFPEWIVYAAMIPPFILTALIALTQAVMGETSDEEVNA
jgi:TRAP-type C4-dicarboxylate transport system permease small subunit